MKKSTIIDLGAALKADDERHAAARKALTVTIENALGEGRPNQPDSKYWERPENQPTSFTFRLPEDEGHTKRMAELAGDHGGLVECANELHVRLVATKARAELAAKHFGQTINAAEALLEVDKLRAHLAAALKVAEAAEAYRNIKSYDDAFEAQERLSDALDSLKREAAELEGKIAE